MRLISLFLLRVISLSSISMVMESAVTVWMVILSYSVFSETSLGASESCHSPSTVARFWSAPRKAFLK